MYVGTGDRGWVDKKIAAKLLCVCKREVERYVARGWLRKIKRGRKVSFSLSEIRKFQTRAEAGGFA